MALIHVYKGIGKDYETYNFTGKIAENIKGVDFSSALILCKGQKINADYCAKEDDIIFIRPIPKGTGTGNMGLDIFLGFITGGIYSGIVSYNLSKEAEKKREEAEKKAKASGERSFALPFLKGARNQVATGRTFPFIIGETLFTPYLLMPPYYTIAGARGEEQYVNMVLECGFNPVLIKKLMLKETPIKIFSDTNAQDGVYAFDSGTFYDPHNIIEIRQATDFQNEDFKHKTVSTLLQKEIPHDHASDDSEENKRIQKEWQDGIVTECASNAMGVEVMILFDGLRVYRDGSWESRTVELQVQWADVSAGVKPEWHDFDNGFIQSRSNGSFGAKKTLFRVRTPRFMGNDIAVYSHHLDYVLQDIKKWIYVSGDTGYPVKDIAAKDLELKELIPDGKEIIFLFYLNWKERQYNNFTSNTFTYHTRKQMRFIARQEFTAAQSYGKKISVRLIRKTPKTTDTAQETVHLLAVQTTCYDAEKSTKSKLVPAIPLEEDKVKRCTRMAVRMIANENTKDIQDSFCVIAAACARTWDKDKKKWSKDKTPTKNLAAWVLEILTNEHHKISRYDDSELNMESFGSWYEYCDEMGFNANGAITDGKPKRTILETLCANGNAALTRSTLTGKIEVAIDKKQSYPIVLLNSENIISSSLTKDFKRRVDGIRVKYINAKAAYDSDTVLFMKENKKYNPEIHTLTETTLEYITEHDHAYKYAWRKMALESAQTRTMTVRVGAEGAYYPIFSCVDIQHNTLKTGLGNAVIKSLVWRGDLLKTIETDGFLDFDDNNSYGVIIQAYGGDRHGVLTLRVEGTGRTTTLKVLDNVRISDDVIPETGDVLSFGILDIDGGFTKIVRRMQIVDLVQGDLECTLTLKDYNEDIYNYGKIPEYKSNITEVPISTAKTLEAPKDYITKTEAKTDSAKAAQEAADLIVHGVRFSNTHRIRDIDYSLQDIIQKIDEDAYNAGASIERSQEHILLKVQDNDEKTRAFIAITKKGILEQVEDNKNSLKSYIDIERDQILQKTEDLKRELTGLLAVQAGAVKAMVEGGGAAGQLALSLELPAMIDKATRKKFAEKCGEAETAAVYGVLADSGYYAIKGNASNAAIKKLWDKAVKTGLLASQIQLNANQIVVQNGDKVAAAFIDGKLRAACIDAENLIVQQLKIDSDKQSNQDFEAYFDKTRGLQIRNKGADILKIDPKTGEAFFTGKVQAGAVELADKGVFIRNGEISIENKGWKGVLRPCNNGVELAILGGDGGNMTKKQLWTYISGGILNLFVLGSITSCGGMYQGNTGAVKNGWENKSTSSDVIFNSIACNGNTWIAVSQNSEMLISTDNGKSWIKQKDNNTRYMNSIACNGNTWIAISHRRDVVISADNGNTWRHKIYDEEAGVGKAVSCNNDTWVIAAGGHFIYVSKDNGNNWTKKDCGTHLLVTSVACNSNTWIVVGDSSGMIYSNNNGNTWIFKNVNLKKWLYCTVCSGNQWVAVGDNGTILLSTDNGNTWTTRNSGTDKGLKSIAHNGSTWVAVGDNGTILLSTDNGNTWTTRNSGTDKNLKSIACNGNTWIAVGNNGTILRSQDTAVWK